MRHSEDTRNKQATGFVDKIEFRRVNVVSCGIRLKCWLQTWLVHAREPRRLWRDVGPRGFLIVQIMMLGVIISALLHPICTIGTLWYIAAGLFFPEVLSIELALLSGLYLAVFAAGYAGSMLCGLVALRREVGEIWLFTLLTMPVYWMLLSPAAWLAVWQFICEPYVWNKTRHGLNKLADEDLQAG